MIAWLIGWSLRQRGLVLLLSGLLIVGGIAAVRQLPLDAIPDLSDVQVIVKTTYPGQAPQVVEDQVTYPLTTALRGVNGAVTVRGYSMYGDSYVYVLFRDGTDADWARARVLEVVNQVSTRLPATARPQLGPDATAVGWVFQYALIDRTGKHDLAQLRSLQDWFLKYELQSLPQVAEVATVGGMVKQYQVVVDPAVLQVYKLPLGSLMQAIQRASGDVGAGSVEQAEARYMIRFAGAFTGLEDLRDIPVSPLATLPTGSGMMGVGATPGDTLIARAPVRLGDIADVRLGPDMREGIAELDGQGEVVGGVVLMRSGGNALDTIRAVQSRLAELQKGLPEGVELRVVYDRSGLIQRAIDTLNERLIEEFVLVALVCLLFLWHGRSSLVVIISLPVAVLAAFFVMGWQGLSADIMSLGGIAIAIGAMVDAAIVMIENLHKHLEAATARPVNRWQIVQQSAIEVGPTLFVSLLIITLSFLPVLALQGEEGRLFKPLAYTKTYAMAAAAVLSITLVPVLLGYCVRGGIAREQDNPVNRLLRTAYRPLLQLALHYPWRVLAISLILTLAGFWPAMHLGSEFMPALDEGDLLYMPTTYPGIAPDKARQLLQQTDRLIRSVPEVAQVFGKVGRAETATDPAPMEMIETTIRLKPRQQWRPGITLDAVKSELQQAVRLPGLTNAWVMPISGRLQMLSTGIKTPLGIKITGPDLEQIERLGERIEAVLGRLPETGSVFAERTAGGRYIQIVPDRLVLGRFGLAVADLQEIISSAVGGMKLAEVVEGRERYPVNLRYRSESRDSLEQLRQLPVIVDSGGIQVSLGEVASVDVLDGPSMLRTENARLSGWVYINPPGQDLGDYLAKASAAIAEQIQLPPGYALTWSGANEHWERAKARLWLVVPLTLIIIVVLLYYNVRSWAGVLIILATLPLALSGGLWLMFGLGYSLSVAAVIGFIVLGGLAVEIGLMTMLYLERALDARRGQLASGCALTAGDVHAAVVAGALLRLRPVAMTKMAIIAGLLPIMLGSGTGSELMRSIAAPVVGGMLSVALLTLVVIPAAWWLWKSSGLSRRA